MRGLTLRIIEKHLVDLAEDAWAYESKKYGAQSICKSCCRILKLVTKQGYCRSCESDRNANGKLDDMTQIERANITAAAKEALNTSFKLLVLYPKNLGLYGQKLLR